MQKMIKLILLSFIGFVLIGLVSGGYNHYSAEEVLIMFMLWLFFVYILVLMIKKDKFIAGSSVVFVAGMISMMIGWALTSSCDYLVFRTKMFFKWKYGDELVLRGAPFWQGDTNGVYYIEGEPDYYFHANTSLFSMKPFDDGYQKAVIARKIDDYLEEQLKDVIPGEFKMSSECMTMTRKGNQLLEDTLELIHQIDSFQMYCMIDRNLVLMKEELISKTLDVVSPYFQNTSSTFYFAFVQDPQSCEKYSSEFHSLENELIRIYELENKQ